MTQQPGLAPGDREILKALSARSDRKGLGRLTGHAGLLLVTGTLVWLAGSSWFVLPAMLAHGVVLIFLFCAVHETIHRTAFASPRLNDAVAHIAGFLVLLPPAWFRAFHLAHHRHTQIPGDDPELDDKRIDTWPRYLWHVSGLKYWSAHIAGLIVHASGRVPERYVAEAARPRVVREARLFLAGYALVAAASVWLGSTAVLAYWGVPALLGQPVLRLYLLAEHGLCPFVGDPFANTRTTLTTRLVRFLAWNMPYHTEHHAFMAVPFHALPAAHEHFRDRLEVLEEDGYVGFNRRYVGEVLLR